MLSITKLRFFIKIYFCIIKYYNVKLCGIFKKLMNVL